jgi:hypothetical protein
MLFDFRILFWSESHFTISSRKLLKYIDGNYQECISPSILLAVYKATVRRHLNEACSTYTLSSRHSDIRISTKQIVCIQKLLSYKHLRVFILYLIIDFKGLEMTVNGGIPSRIMFIISRTTEVIKVSN